MREAVLVAFLRRMSQQPTFVVMGPGSRPGRRVVVDALARHKSPQIQFSNSLSRNGRALPPTTRKGAWRGGEEDVARSRPTNSRHCERSEAIHSCLLPWCAMDCFA